LGGIGSVPMHREKPRIWFWEHYLDSGGNTVERDVGRGKKRRDFESGR